MATNHSIQFQAALCFDDAVDDIYPRYPLGGAPFTKEQEKEDEEFYASLRPRVWINRVAEKRPLKKIPEGVDLGSFKPPRKLDHYGNKLNVCGFRFVRGHFPPKKRIDGIPFTTPLVVGYSPWYIYGEKLMGERAACSAYPDEVEDIEATAKWMNDSDKMFFSEYPIIEREPKMFGLVRSPFGFWFLAWGKHTVVIPYPYKRLPRKRKQRS